MISSLGKSISLKKVNSQLFFYSCNKKIPCRFYSTNDDWSFLEKPQGSENLSSDQQTSSTSNSENPTSGESSNLESLVFSTQSDDMFAQPKNDLNLTRSPMSKLKSESRDDIVIGTETPKISGKDLKTAFTPPRQKLSDGNTASGIHSTQQERAIFAKIFDSILANKNLNDTSTLKNKSSKVSSSMQALFEKTFISDRDNNSDNKFSSRITQRFGGGKTGGSSDASDSKEEVRLGITNEDVRKYPLSMGSLFMSHPTQSLNISQLFEIQNILKKRFSPILEYINNDLKTDHDVVMFYRKKVLPRFKIDNGENESNDKGPNVTKSQSGVTKSKAQQELEELEKVDITIDTFPVNHNTLPFLLKEMMRILADDFGSPLEALSLFELTKKESIDVYVAGCNIGVYNEVLRIKWNGFNDLYLIESIISEMQVNGIKGNSETADVLGGIASSLNELKDSSFLVTDNTDDGQPIIKDSAVPRTSLWCQEDEERSANINRYRLKMMEELVVQDSVQQDQLMSALMSRG